MNINLPKRTAGLLIMVVALLLLSTGCTSEKTTAPANTAAANTNNSNTTTSPTNTTVTNASLSFKNACQLFSLAEAEAIVGVTLLPPDPATGKIFLSSYDNNYYCVYATQAKGTTSRSVWVGVDRFGSTSTARSNFDGEKARLDREVDVTGYGDVAYWDADQGFFRVLRGKEIFTTQVLHGLTGNQDQAKGMMTTIMGRML